MWICGASVLEQGEVPHGPGTVYGGQDRFQESQSRQPKAGSVDNFQGHP
jgi:hypothetical protein